MRNFEVQLFDTTRINSEPTYKIALSASDSRSQGQAMKDYSSEEVFTNDLKKRLRCTNRFIEGFFSNPKTNNVLQGCPLNDEDAAYFGWHQ